MEFLDRETQIWMHYKLLFDFMNSSNMVVTLKKVWEFKITEYFTQIQIFYFDSLVVRKQERSEELFETHYLELNILISSCFDIVATRTHILNVPRSWLAWVLCNDYIDLLRMNSDSQFRIIWR